MARKDPRDNFVFLDHAKLRYNHLTGVAEIVIWDNSLEVDQVVLTIPKESADDGVFRKLLKKFGLAPAANVNDDDLPTKVYRESWSEETYATLLNMWKPGPKQVPIGANADNELISFRFSGDEAPNMFITGADKVMKTALIRDLSAVFSVRNSYSFKTYGYTRKQGLFPEVPQMEILRNEFELVLLLRKLLEESVQAGEQDACHRVVILDDFSYIVEDMAAAEGPGARTEKAVRAEILSLIEDISRKGRSLQISFIFVADRMDRKNYNAFIGSTSTRLSVGEPSTDASYVLFGKNVTSFSSWMPGRAYFQQGNTNAMIQLFEPARRP